MTFIADSIPFATRLAHAVAWCEQHATADDPVASLRRIERRTLPADRADYVSWIATFRSHGLHGRALDSAATWRARGRLLVYYPDSDTADGGAQQASAGYFDVHATPPCDTWIAIGRDDTTADNSSYAVFLLAWVPACFIELAGQGIWADPMGSIVWVEDAPVIAAAVERELAR